MNKLSTILLLFLLTACNNNPTTPTNTDVLSDMDKDTISTKEEGEKDDQTYFVDLVNELLKGALIIVKKEGQYDLEIGEGYTYYDNYQIEHLSPTRIDIELFTGGTGGSFFEKHSFVLMEKDTNPKVLKIETESGTASYSHIMMEHRGKYSIPDYLETEEEIEEYELKMAEEDYEEAQRNAMFGNTEFSSFELALWVKIDTNWKQSNVFPVDLAETITKYIPLFNNKTEVGDLYFEFNGISYDAAQENKTYFDQFYKNILDDLGTPFFLNFKRDIISLGTSSFNTLKLKWTGRNFDYHSKPAKEPKPM